MARRGAQKEVESHYIIIRSNMSHDLYGQHVVVVEQSDEVRVITLH